MSAVHTIKPAADAAEGAGALAQLAAWLAAADPDQGRMPAEACDVALQAMALAARLRRPLDQGRAGAWRCTHLLRLGRHAELLAEAAALQPLLLAPELAAERREFLRVLTLAASETGALDTALDAAHELVRISALLGEDGPALSATFALAACFERMGDSWQAVRLLVQALKDHGDGAPPLPLLVANNGLCAIALGTVHQLLGTGGDAEVPAVLARARAAGEKARSLLQRLPDPAYEVAVLGNLGETLLHQGALAEAEPLLRQALATAAARGLQAHAWRVQASLGSWMLARGDAAGALAGMRSLIAGMGAEEPQQTAIRAHHAAYRACKLLGEHAEALDHLEFVERTQRQRTAVQLRAQSRLFVTRTEAQQAQWQVEQARLDAQHQRERAAEFAERAERDPLTGLGNRRHLERRCAELLPAAQREGRPLALAQIDIDRFKAINDLHGHATGDRVLVAMAQLLRENTRAGDVLARHGGEEFVVVLPGMALEQAVEICERLRERVSAHDWSDAAGPVSAVTISIGLAAAPPYDAAALMQSADEALYAAKRGGRNRLCLGGPRKG